MRKGKCFADADEANTLSTAPSTQRVSRISRRRFASKDITRPTDRSLEETEPGALRSALAERNDAFREELDREQRALSPTLWGALGIAVGLIVGTGGLIFLLNTVVH